MKCVLGIDTSCYTTSVSLVGDGGFCVEKRKLLAVKPGERGLQQSGGVFQHVQNLPILLGELMDAAPDVQIAGVCASTRPRDLADSYMPVFTVGGGYGRAIAEAGRLPFCETSHQQGHVRAAMEGTDLSGTFLGIHLSGGTTEIFLVGDALKIECLGGTSDLNAGQLVDRVGVALGLAFPAGPALERLALAGTSRSQIPTSMSDMRPSFSGAEAQAMRMIDSGIMRAEDIAAEVFSVIARTIAKLTARAVGETGTRQVLLAGGVASSTLLRRLVPERLQRLGCLAKLYWARPELSSDNAVGIALIGAETFFTQWRNHAI